MECGVLVCGNVAIMQDVESYDAMLNVSGGVELWRYAMCCVIAV